MSSLLENLFSWPVAIGIPLAIGIAIGVVGNLSGRLQHGKLKRTPSECIWGSVRKGTAPNKLKTM